MQPNLSLNCYEFEDNLVDTYADSVSGHNGIHYIFRFSNDYGASVVKVYGTSSYTNDLWELAVILFVNEDGDEKLGPDDYILVKPIQITNTDIIENLTNEEVIDILRKIKEL